jgi:hypothetical protein
MVALVHPSGARGSLCWAMSEFVKESRLTHARVRWVIVAAAALTLAYLLAGALTSASSIGRSDFTSFYGAATLLRDGHGAGIYNPALQESMHRALVAPDRIGNLPFVDPPAAAAILLPLTFLPLDLAYHLWALVEFCLLALAAMIAAASAPWPARTPRRWRYAAVLAAMAGAGTYGVVVQAQWTPFIALGLSLAYRQWRAGKHASGAFLLVIAAGLTKPHLAIVLGAFMLGWRDRRLLTGALAGVAVAVLANLAVAGPQGVTGFISLALTSQSQWALSTYSSFISIPALLFGNSTTTRVAAAVFALVACAVGWRLGRTVRRRTSRLEPALAAAAMLSLLAAPHALLHDTVMLAPCVVWMLAWATSHVSSVRVSRSPAMVATAWGTITTAGFVSLVVAEAVPPGWIVSFALVAVAVPASLIALAPMRQRAYPMKSAATAPVLK